MDLGLSGRMVAVLGSGTLAARTSEVFVAEGARVTGEASEACDAVVFIAPSTPDQALESNDDAVMFGDWKQVSGLAAACRLATPGMARRGQGRIVWVGPIEAKLTRDDPGADLDAIVGLGALGLMKAMSGELGPDGITCNSVLWDGTDIDSTAAAVLFLASAASSYVTGTVLSVDGGSSGSLF